MGTTYAHLVSIVGGVFWTSLIYLLAMSNKSLLIGYIANGIFIPYSLYTSIWWKCMVNTGKCRYINIPFVSWIDPYGSYVWLIGLPVYLDIWGRSRRLRGR